MGGGQELGVGRDDPAVVVRDSQRRMNRRVKGRFSLLRRCASADAQAMEDWMKDKSPASRCYEGLKRR